jgi:hypothetical protein
MNNEMKPYCSKCKKEMIDNGTYLSHPRNNDETCPIAVLTHDTPISLSAITAAQMRGDIIFE